MFEFRLYYDDTGKVICYTSDNSVPGDNYIVIDAQTYAESRPDIRIVEGKIKRQSDFVVVSKMVESTTGVSCEPNDICIISDNGTYWEPKVMEYVNS